MTLLFLQYTGQRVLFRDVGKRLSPLSILLLLFLNTGCAGDLFSPPRKAVHDQVDPVPPKAQIIIANNMVYQNNRAGVRVRGNVPVEISKCDVYQNGRAGINLEHSAKAIIKNNNIFQNSMAGIASNNAALLQIHRNLVHQNEQGGIRIRKGEKSQPAPDYVFLRHNKIFHNKQGGLYTIANTNFPIELTVSDNALYRNQEAGIRVENNVHMTVINNNLYKNGTAGVAAYASGDIPPMFDIYQNKIFFNQGAGVFVNAGITGQIGISNNLIYNNFRAGIASGLWGKSDNAFINLEIFHNTIVGNGSDTEGAGIRNDSKGRVIIKNNIVAYNFTTGIMTRACKKASYNLLFANGETSAEKDTSDNLSFLTDRMQQSGCIEGHWDILAPPRFINPDQYDFSLHEGSPAQNSADSIQTPYFLNIGSSDLGATLFLLPDEPLQERP